MDFIPGLPDLTDRPPGRRPARPPRDRTAAIGLGLVVASLLLLQLGLALDFGSESLWSLVPTWSAFATLAVVVGALPFVLRAGRNRGPAGEANWKIAAAGVAGLAVFWALVVLPVVATNRGFLLTAALGALGGALWISRGRTR